MNRSVLSMMVGIAIIFGIMMVVRACDTDAHIAATAPKCVGVQQPDGRVIDMCEVSK